MMLSKPNSLKKRRVCRFVKKFWPELFVGLFIFVSLIAISYADGRDFMLPMKENVKSTFGDGSFAQQMLYLGEALLGGVGYIKTKNPMLLAGTPILMLVTHFTMGVVS